MDRFFDRRINDFFLSDRRRQIILNALEAVVRSSPCLAIKCADGVVMAAANRDPQQLRDFTVNPWDKIFKINNDVICGVSGLMEDAKQLVGDMSNLAAIHETQHGIPIEVAKLTECAADIQQASTMNDPPRPFAASLLCAGWDSREGYQVYQTDPSGYVAQWRGAIIGQGSLRGMKVLQTEINANSPPTMEGAKGTAIKAMGAMLQEGYFGAANIEMATLHRHEQTTCIENVPKTVLKEMIDKYDAAKLEVEGT